MAPQFSFKLNGSLHDRGFPYRPYNGLSAEKQRAQLARYPEFNGTPEGRTRMKTDLDFG